MQQQQPPTTFEQKVNIMQNITLFPALTIMVFLRRKLGFRFLDMMKIQIVVVLLIAYSAFSSLTFGPAAGGIIFLFSLAVLITASIERRLRWRDIKRGISWHTYSRGVSWFSSILPLSETATKRFIDPAVALIIGIVFFFLFRPLGFYILLSAVCLFLFETIDYQKQIDRMLDVYDSLIDSEVQSDNAEYFQGGEATGERPVEETAGIPTGVSPDLAAAIEKKRARSARSQQTQQAPPTPKPVAVSSSPQLQYLQDDLQQAQATQEPPSRVRRKTGVPEHVAITNLSQPDNVADQSISMQAAPSQPATPPPAATPAPQAPQGIPVIQSIDDPAFAALPSGAQFVTPDGKTRWKK